MDILGINAAFVMGGCMGCSTATAFGVAYPESTLGLVLHWPVGGVHWRQNGLDRFQAHVNFVKDNGLAAVVDLAREKQSFWAEPKAGPWASTIVADEGFAGSFASQSQERYLAMVALMGQTLFDRDTATGPEPLELLALRVPSVIIPGADAAHATSAARYLQECLEGSVYHDVPVEEQNRRPRPSVDNRIPGVPRPRARRLALPFDASRYSGERRLGFQPHLRIEEGLCGGVI